jgi:hypothetical protein
VDQKIVDGTGVPEVVLTQAVDVVETPAKKIFRNKQCRVCGIEFIPSGAAQKSCDLHRKPAKGTDALKEYEADAQERSREKERDAQAKKDGRFNSKTVITKKEAIEILEKERLIKNPHVVETCVELADQAARHFKIPFNAHLMTHGLRLTLQAIETKAKVAPPDIQPEEVEGEVLQRTDLWALWCYGFWRQPNATFEQWLFDRFRLKFSAFELSNLLGKEDFGKKHEEWTSFAPRWNPSGLKPGYTQKQGLAWLDAQQSDTEGHKKRYLLVASRNSMKSTWARILALTLTITYPDARILIVSETNKLSRKAMKEFRGYLEAAPNSPTLFQQYFSEYTIAPDSGEKLIYNNPLAHLGLPQNSVESSSMESANTGSRFDFCVFDDPISRDNGTANEEQRAAAISKHSSVMALREPAGFALNIQTPWVVDDLGDVMIKRNEEDQERPLAVRIDPVMEIRPEAAGIPLLDLKEKDVVLNFLPKLNWKFVRDEMRSPEGINFFRTQYMTEWVPDDDRIKLQFDEQVLRNHIRPPGFFDRDPRYQLLETVQGCDTARSSNRFADFSAVCTAKLYVDKEPNKYLLVIADLVMERLRLSQLAVTILEQHQKWHPGRALVEKDSYHEALQAEIDKAAMLRGLPISHRNFFWKPTQGFSVKDRALRVKALEGLLASDQLWFTIPKPETQELLVSQFVRFDGVTKSGSSNASKDDGPDVISQIWEAYGPKEFGEKSAVQQEAEDFDYQRRLQQMQHDYYFGSPVPPSQQIYVPPADGESPDHPFDRAGFKRFGFTRAA